MLNDKTKSRTTPAVVADPVGGRLTSRAEGGDPAL